MTIEDLNARFHTAIQYFWNTRESQQARQEMSGRTDAGARGAVTGGAQMATLEKLVFDLLVEAGLDHLDIRTKKALELPGYYRPEKKRPVKLPEAQRNSFRQPLFLQIF